MNKRLKKILSGVLIICMMLPFTSAVLPLSAAENAFSAWTTDGWTQKTESGTPCLASPGGTLDRIYLKGVTSGNVLTYDVRIDNAFGTVDGNIGTLYICTSGVQYFFEYNTVLGIARVRRFGTDGSDTHVGLAKNVTIAAGSWTGMEIVFQDGLLRWKIDGETVHEIQDTGSDEMTGGSLILQGYNTKLSLRHIQIENEQIEIVEKQKYDFEFKTAQSIKDFTAENGAVTWENGRLVYTLSGEESKLCSPAISVDAGDPYAMLLPIRNTLAVRLKNNTSASSVRVHYMTTTAPRYDDSRSAVYAVEPNSDYTTYFFNLSDCSTVAGGYLYGFTIEPIGADSGSLEIDAITFEREAVLYDYAGTIDSCIATETTITVKGTLNPTYAGKTVKLYETMVENFAETLKDSEVIAEVVADGTSFTIEVPFVNGNLNRLSSIFLVGVEGVKLSERFQIENLWDFTSNPYAFELPGYTVKVTDDEFGAKGDAFTNDTAAIQAAIDHVSAQGGGMVIVPGDDSRYGRRYVITNIKIKDNVELHLEKGAVLWQSPRAEDYDYDVAFGHDVSIPGVNWTHAPVCHNLPLIQGDRAKNIKISGEGIIRTVDTGSENNDSVSATTLWTGCQNRIHVMPIGLYACENVEITGVNIRRGNVWHIFNFGCKNVYIGDISALEVTCASGDGISVGAGSQNVIIDRFILYTNDDAIVLFTSYNEPRGLVWWFPTPEADNSLDNVIVRNSNILGGHGITFITWGTDNPDLSKQEIRNIEVYNSVLYGGSTSIGTWPDNPYYGAPFDNTEEDDYSPVKQVRIYNNIYRGSTTLLCIKATDFVTDSSIRSASDFQYGNFERGDRLHPDWVAGLSNWTILETAGYTEGNVTAAGDASNHYGLIRNGGALVQGLWMNRGAHTLTIDTAITKGNATLIVQDALTGEMLAEQAVAPSADFTKQTMSFTIAASTTAYIGVRYEGEDEVKLDNAAVTSTVFRPDKYFTEAFDDADALQMTNNGFTVTDGVAQVGNGQAGLMTLTTPFDHDSFDLRFRLRYDGCLSSVDGNFGLTFLGADINNGYNVNYNPVYHFLQSRKLSGGAQEQLDILNGFDLPVGRWVNIEIRAQNGICRLYMDGEKLTEFEVGHSNGTITIIAYNINCAIDDIRLAEAGTLGIPGVVTPPETDAPETEPAEPNEYFTENFDSADSLQMTNNGFTVADGVAQIGNGQSGFMSMTTPFGYSEFDLHFKLRFDACMSAVDGNFGISFLGADINNGYNINYNPVYHFLQARTLVGGGMQEQLDIISGFDLPAGEWVDVAMRVQNGQCTLYIGGEKLMEFAASESSGPLTFIAYNVNCAIDDIQFAEAGSTEMPGDEVTPPETDAPETEAPDPEVTVPEVTETETPEVESSETVNGDIFDDEKDGGCFGSISSIGAIMSILALSVIAWLSRAKRKNDTV